MACGELKIYRKPCRAKPRVFSLSDLRRINKVVALQGENRGRQIGLLGFDLGFFLLVNASGLNEGEIKRIAESFDTAIKVKDILQGLLTKNIFWGLIAKLVLPTITGLIVDLVVELTYQVVNKIIDERALMPEVKGSGKND